MDSNRAMLKLKNILRILRGRNINYKDIMKTTLYLDSKDGMVSTDELSSAFVSHFAVPILPSEVILVASKYQKRNSQYILKAGDSILMGGLSNPQPSACKALTNQLNDMTS
jgi:enamine deaminase RidA (YjgF/YER057c/UK114 family)